MTKPSDSSRALTKGVQAIKCSDQIQKRIVDQSAETSAELVASSGCGISMIRKIILENLECKRWEQVWKRVGKNTVPAFRVKK